MLSPNDVEEARHLAHHLIHQVEWVDLAGLAALAERAGLTEAVLAKVPDRPRELMTAHVREPASREALRRIVDNVAARLLVSAPARADYDGHPVPAACEMYTRAAKGLLVASGPGNGWLNRHRLAVKFESIPYPWVQDPPKPSPLQLAAEMGLNLGPVAAA